MEFKIWLNEAILRWSQKYRDRDVDEIPAGFWKWVQQKMQTDPQIFPKIEDEGRYLNRDEVINLVRRKASGERHQQPQQPTAPQQQKIWYLATVKQLPNLQPGEQVALAKRPDGNWDVLDTKNNTQVVANKNVVNAVASVRDDQNNPVSSNNPQELFDQKPTPKLTTKQDRPQPDQVRLPQQHMTKYNQKIENTFINTQNDIMIDALAGTGKTTMLKHLSSFIRPGQRWLYLVFNKKNAVESTNAFPQGVDVMTTHSYLGQILRQQGRHIGGNTQLPPQNIKGQSPKLKNVIDTIAPLNWPRSQHMTADGKSKFHWSAKYRVQHICNLAKAFALNPNDPQIKSQLGDIIDKYAIDMDLSTDRINQDRDFTDDILDMVIKALKITMPGQMSKQHGHPQFMDLRDQDDTLWYAAIFADQIRWNAPPLKYDVILMDEVQDFNNCQIVMAQKLKEAGARIVCVGDPHQSLYLFRGADADAFDKLKSLAGTQAHSLPINFRSGENIIKFVRENTHVKDLQASPNKKGQGEVTLDLEYDGFMSMIGSEMNDKQEFDEDTAIISRTNAPLTHTALYCLQNNIDFQIMGKDLLNDIKKLINKVTWNKPQDHAVDDLSYELSSYFSDLEQKWQNKLSKQDELKEIEEYVDSIISVLQFLKDSDYKEHPKAQPMRTVKDLLGYFERKLGGVDPDTVQGAVKIANRDPKKTLVLTTAHKSKGLEYGRVFVMKPDSFDPAGKKIRTAAQAQQERNAWYVTLTRAMNNLFISADDKP